MSKIYTNTTDLQEVLEALNGKASGGADPVLQDKTVTPTTAQQTITADSGYDGLDTVTVNAIQTETKTVTPSTSQQNVTPSSGKYLSQVTVNAMPNATQATPSITVNSSGLITASATQTAGYVAAGTKSGTKQLTTQAAKTITPSTSSQTAVASGRYTTGAVTVAAIPDTYIQPSGTLDVTANGTHDVKNYASVNVNVAGSGGGGSIETCTVTITSSRTKPIYGCIYSYPNDDGEIQAGFFGQGQQKITLTLSNVICGTPIAVYAPNISACSTSGMTLSLISYWKDTSCSIATLLAPTVAGQTGTATIS